MYRMELLLLFVATTCVTLLLVTGCAASYTPRTKEGASCKVHCSVNTQGLMAYNRCVRACADAEKF